MIRQIRYRIDTTDRQTVDKSLECRIRRIENHRRNIDCVRRSGRTNKCRLQPGRGPSAYVQTAGVDMEVQPVTSSSLLPDDLQGRNIRAGLKDDNQRLGRVRPACVDLGIVSDLKVLTRTVKADRRKAVDTGCDILRHTRGIALGGIVTVCLVGPKRDIAAAVGGNAHAGNQMHNRNRSHRACRGLDRIFRLVPSRIDRCHHIVVRVKIDNRRIDISRIRQQRRVDLYISRPGGIRAIDIVPVHIRFGIVVPVQRSYSVAARRDQTRRSRRIYTQQPVGADHRQAADSDLTIGRLIGPAAPLVKLAATIKHPAAAKQLQVRSVNIVISVHIAGPQGLDIQIFGQRKRPVRGA